MKGFSYSRVSTRNALSNRQEALKGHLSVTTNGLTMSDENLRRKAFQNQGWRALSGSLDHSIGYSSTDFGSNAEGSLDSFDEEVYMYLADQNDPDIQPDQSRVLKRSTSMPSVPRDKTPVGKSSVTQLQTHISLTEEGERNINFFIGDAEAAGPRSGNHEETLQLKEAIWRLESEIERGLTLKDIHESLMEEHKGLVAKMTSIESQVSSVWEKVQEIRNESCFLTDSQIQEKSRTISNFKRQLGSVASGDEADDLSSMLVEEFECPVCFEPMRPPKHIYACSNTHLFCQRCYQVLTKSEKFCCCPKCRENFKLTPPIRNRLAERWAKKFFC